ncbi:MAG TPA: hypothetical protein VHZ28_13060 [Terracidiphilus sp.]|jgi:outer membrane lipoprotein-sorting protein|nr:hypothetical protein [Terracidiphilus sp.]
MLGRVASFFAFVVCLAGFSSAASAQAVVHALTGTVNSIDPAAKTITMFLDNGKQDTFKDMTNSKVSFSADRKMLASTTTPDDLKKQGAYVVVFYFGGSEDRTAVALRGLGAGPFTATTGIVTKFDPHRSLTVQDNSGAMQTFTLAADTITESGAGAQSALKFQADKGGKVRIVGASKDGSPIALFVSAN